MNTDDKTKENNSDAKLVLQGALRIANCPLALPAPREDAHYLVYKLTSPENKIYIGYTGEPLEVRIRKGYHVGTESSNVAITVAMRKFGKKNFKKEVLRDHLTQEEAWELEDYYIRYYDSMNPEKGYNCMTGGPSLGCRGSEASKRRKSRLYEENPELSVKASDAMKEKHAKCPSWKVQIREDGKKKAAEGEIDYFIYSDKRPKRVICLETGVVYASISAAIRETGFFNIQKACVGSVKSCGGKHWRFV